MITDNWKVITGALERMPFNFKVSVCVAESRKLSYTALNIVQTLTSHNIIHHLIVLLLDLVLLTF